MYDSQLLRFCFYFFFFSSNQHYHQHHPQQRSNGGSGGVGGVGVVQHSMHPNRQNYHNGQMASSGGKGPYQYHTNASSSTINGNSRVTILHKPSQIEHPVTTYPIRSDPPIENTDDVEVFVEASEEQKYFDMGINLPLSECPNVTNPAEGAEKASAAQNKTSMCLINELVRSNKVRCDETMHRERERESVLNFSFFMLHFVAYASVSCDW